MTRCLETQTFEAVHSFFVTLFLDRLSVCRMSISDVPMKCRRNALLIRTDRRVVLVKSCCTMGRHRAIANRSWKMASTGVSLGKMVNFLGTRDAINLLTR